MEKVVNRKVSIKLNDGNLYLGKLLDFYDEIDKKDVTFESLSKNEIREYQEFALGLTINHASNNNEYYRNSFSQTEGDNEENNNFKRKFSQLPLLNKELIRGDSKRLLCCDEREIGQVHVTSGTTGKPIYTQFTFADQYIYEFLPIYEKLFPEREEDVAAIALPYECALPGLGFQRLYQIGFGSKIISIGKGGYMAPIDKSIELIKEFQVTFLATTPSYAAYLYEEAINMGIDVKNDLAINRIVLTGEGCSFEFRKRLEKLWGCEVSFFYGSTECGVIGVECSEHNGYHVMQGHVYVEIVDINSGDILPYNRIGEIVVTTLLREGMPMVRYKTGDVGYLKESNCNCGNNMDMLYLSGRLENQLNINGQEISLYYLENIIMSVTEIGLWYELAIEKDGVLDIHVELIDKNTSKEMVTSKLNNRLKSNNILDFKITFVDRISRTYGKAQRIILK